ncbi:hypothetical protein [Enterococcus gilvus]|jgi:hypothetical protein|uniref:Uncharacterized protein n=1 Tax=Enterococcus gilvus ATCC BAA-350 TaxID=1158614 RepID=R2XA79_9ENTE|nr:hypothetical protein [Enterococcus gilvus]EOI51498.1 hypothetical protein UKC_04173 [Enterococcus gilvus ATCC BAA-350]EOW77191.1 hypothetical protein I592_04167 [Enterococcus gilvus ATCC BAA-350]
MRREVARPKEAVTEIKQGKLDLADVLIIMGSAIVGFLTKFLVPEILEVVYVLAYPISLYFLLSPSDVPNKKTYQVVIQLFFKDNRTYPAMPKSKEETDEL